MDLEDQEGPNNQEECLQEKSFVVPAGESDILQESVHLNRTMKKDKKDKEGQIVGL